MNNDPALLEDDLITADVPEAASARQQLKIVADDVRSLIDSEISYYKNRLTYTGEVAKWTGLYLLIAACALFGGVVALILGILLIATIYLGPVWATLLVTVAAIATAIIFALIARSKSRDFYVSEIDKDVSNE